MASLKVLLLGAPVVLHNDKPVQIPRRTHRALLFYLAARGDAVGRAELLTLFWPEENDPSARSRLRDALGKLRQQLPDPTVLQATVDQVGLDYSKVYVDVLDFQRVAQQLGRLPWKLSPDEPLPEPIHRSLLEAINLWRSIQFMEGANLPNTERLDSWLTLTSETLQRQRQLVLERLSDHEVAVGDLEAALYWARRVVEGDELNETYHQRALELLIRLGRRSDALRYCDYVEEIFDRELGQPPPLNLQELCEKIEEPSVHTEATRDPWPIPLGTELPFVGQAHALEAARHAYHRGGILLLQEEAGTGKTRLVRELYETLEHAPRLLVGYPRQMEENLPFQTLTDLLRRSVNPEEWLALAPAWQTQMALLLPEVAALASPPTQTSQGQAQLFEAVHQLFVLVAQKARLLFFLDNAQWADESSLDAFTYLVERGIFGRGTGLFVVAYRPAEATPKLNRFISTLRGSPSFTDLTLAPLTEDAVAQIITGFFGKPPTPAFASRLAQESGGNPLFLLENLRLLLDLAIQPDSANLPPAFPAASGIHALLRERIHRLSTTCQQMLGIAAIIGSQFDLYTLQDIARLDENRFIEVMECLEKHNLIQPLPLGTSSSVEYSFVNEKIREVLLMEMGHARQSLLHRRVAHRIEENLGAEAPQQAAVLARHYEAAAEPDKAFFHWLQAGRRARQFFSATDEIAAQANAERLLHRNPGKIDEVLVYQLYSEWGQSAFEKTDFTRLDQIAQKLTLLGETRQSPLLYGAGLSKTAFACLMREQFAEGLAMIERALPYLEASGHILSQITAYTRKGAILARLGKPDEAASAYQKACTLGADPQDGDVIEAIANAKYQIAALKGLNGWPAEGLAFAQQSLQSAVFSRVPIHQVRSLSLLSILNLYTGEMILARQYAEQSLEMAQRVHNEVYASYLHVYFAKYCLYAGHLGECLAHIELARQLALATGQKLVLAETYAVAGDLYYMLMDFPRALQAYRDGLPTETNSIEYYDLLQRIGLMTGLSGSPEEGRAILQKVAAAAQGIGAEHVLLQARLGLASLDLLEKQTAPAHSALTELLAEFTNRKYALMGMMARFMLARLELDTGSPQAAVDNLNRILEHPSTPHLPLIEMMSLSLKRAAQKSAGYAADDSMTRIQAILQSMQSEIHDPTLMYLLTNLGEYSLQGTHPFGASFTSAPAIP